MSGSSGNSQVIREFLVSIGYVETGRSGALEGLASMTKGVLALGVSIKAAAIAVTSAVAVIAAQFEQMYYLGQRANSTVESMKALGFAASQVGSSADAARGSLESLGRFMRVNPGAGGLLESLGVQARGANGQLRDTSDLLVDVLSSLEKKPPAVQAAIGNFLGIDERTLLANINEMRAAQADYRRMLREAGLDADQAARGSVRFMREIRSLGAAFGVLRDKAASLLVDQLGDEVKKFRLLIEHNFGRITGIIMAMAKAILSAASIFTSALGRVVDAVTYLGVMFDGLGENQKHLIKWFAEAGTAFLAFSMVIAKSPVGAALIALGLILDDMMAWKRGDDHLIPWEKISDGLAGTGSSFKVLGTDIENIIKALGHLGRELAKLQGPQGWAGAFGEVGRSAIRAFMSTLHNVMHDVANLVNLAAALTGGDWAEAKSIIHHWNDGNVGHEIDGNRGGATPQENARAGLDPSTGLPTHPVGAYAELLNQRRAEDGGGDWYHRYFQADAPGSTSFGRFINRVRGNTTAAAPAGAPAGGGSGGIAGRPAEAEEHARMQRAYDRLTTVHHMSSEDAVALIANFHEESGFNLGSEGDPDVPGGSGGIGQWNRRRRENFATKFGHDVTRGTEAEQIDFAAWELHNTHANVAASLARAHGVAAKSDEVLRLYEAPSEENQAKRRGGHTALSLLGPLAAGAWRGAPAAPPAAVGAPASVAEMERRRGLAPGALLGLGTLPQLVDSAPPAPLASSLNRYLGTIAPPLGAADNSTSNTTTNAPVVNQTNNITLSGGQDQARQVIDGVHAASQTAVRTLQPALR